MCMVRWTVYVLTGTKTILICHRSHVHVILREDIVKKYPGTNPDWFG